MDNSNIVIVRVNPEYDYSYAVLGGDVALTKQEKFRPVFGYEARFERKEDREFFDSYDIYVKSKDKKTLIEYEKNLKESIRSTAKPEHPFERNIPLEVTVFFLMLPERLQAVDIDNLLKTTIDCFKGIIFEDDSQILNIFGRKIAGNYNGLLVGIRKIDTKKSIFEDIRFLSIEEKGIERWLI